MKWAVSYVWRMWLALNEPKIFVPVFRFINFPRDSALFEPIFQ